MRIDRRMPENCIHPLQDLIRNRMLQRVGFIVNDRPIQAQNLNKKKLHQSMPAKNVKGQLLAATG